MTLIDLFNVLLCEDILILVYKNDNVILEYYNEYPLVGKVSSCINCIVDSMYYNDTKGRYEISVK